MAAAIILIILIVIAAFLFLVEQLPSGTVVISGRGIAEDTGQGVAGVTVSAVRQGNLDPKSGDGAGITFHKRELFSVNGVTDNNGRYELKGLESGKYAVYFITKEQRYIDAQKQRCLDVRVAEKIELKDFILRIGGSISGTVYGADGKTPLRGVRVTATVLGTEEGQGGVNDSSRSMQTDDNGKYALHGLPDSSDCVITLAMPGYEPLTRKVKIKKGKGVSNVNFKVKEPMVYKDGETGVLVNVISAEDKAPLSNIHISLWDVSKEINGNKDGNTDTNGQSLITGIPAGLHSLSVFRKSAWGSGWIKKEGILVKEGKIAIVNVELDKRERKKWKHYTCE